MRVAALGRERYRSAVFFLVPGIGWRDSTYRDAVVSKDCRHCGGQRAHAVFRTVRRARLANVTLFPIRIRYSLQCAGCAELVGASPYPIPTAAAEELLSTAPRYP
jgi:hypothetical protein